MKKRAYNFRLSNEASVILVMLNKELDLSKTEILERALRRYAETKLKKQTGLLKYAGTLSEETADDMLDTIQSSKINKDKDIEL